MTILQLRIDKRQFFCDKTNVSYSELPLNNSLVFAKLYGLGVITRGL